ncbi:MAG: ATP synthase subunit I [Oscillospiraceae bacterium]|nr:ATP synthase subunit I [Oscillospiraceae bacterium]
MKTISNRRVKSEAEIIALEELKQMTPFFLIANGAVLLISGILGLFIKVDWGVFTGLLIGNIAAAVNFYLIGFTTGRAIRRRDTKRARSYFAFSYGMRMLGIFGVFAVLITFGLINPITAIAPLLYPSVYYKIRAVFNKSV